MLYDKTKNSLHTIQVLDPNIDETSLANLIEQYTIDNFKTGFLVFQVFQDSPLQGVLPVENAKITVNKLLGDNTIFISKVLTTDRDGKTDPLPLPTVSEELSKVPGNDIPYSLYSASVEAPNFLKTERFNIPIFEDITIIQPFNLIPL